MDPADMQPHANPSPIQRLCPEILTEIFAFCPYYYTPKELPWGVQNRSSRKALILLCSVCSSWRSLAISTPRLWQTFHFDNSDRIFEIDAESIIDSIHTWLDRSRKLPLFIRIKIWTSNLTSNTATKCRLILRILSKEISRWGSFEVNDIGMWATPPHFGILPMLHAFDTSKSSLIEGIPFTAAPRLKRLSLRSLPNITSVSAIPWDQLVELTIEEPQPISMIVEAIRCCPLLESLLAKESKEGGSLTFGSITRHNTLRRLKLFMRTYNNTITDYLALPALKDLSLWTYRPIPGAEVVDAKFCCSQLVAFFTRSNCELEKFQFAYHPKFGPSELLKCLNHRSCQTLTHLEIIGESEKSPPPSPTIDKELLIRLTYSDADDDVPLCPKLRHLQLFHCYWLSTSCDLLGRMIQSRCFGRAQNAQLRTLELYTYYVSREDYEMLQFAKSNGGLKFKYVIPGNSLRGVGTSEDEGDDDSD